MVRVRERGPGATTGSAAVVSLTPRAGQRPVVAWSSSTVVLELRGARDTPKRPSLNRPTKFGEHAHKPRLLL
jgi:hypothetical protein